MPEYERQETAKEEPKASVRRVIEEAWNNGKVDVLDEHYYLQESMANR